MTERFALGDIVYKARFDRDETWIVCPDCLGSTHVRVILGDGTEVIIECGGCDPGGYQPSTGRIRQYVYRVTVARHLVTGVLQRADETEYELDRRLDGCSWTSGTSRDCFATEDEALAHGETLRAQHEAKENKRLLAKTKDTKSWARNASYHREEIKRLEAQVAWHRSKVQVCQAHLKNKEEGTQ